MIVIEAGTEDEKKNTLQLSGNVLSRKEQIEDTILTSRTRDRPAILRGRPSEAKSSCSVILRPCPKYWSGNRIRDRPPFSQMLHHMN